MFQWVTSGTGSGTVKWLLNGVEISSGESLNATMIAIANATGTASGTQYIYHESESATFELSGSEVRLQVERDYANDTLSDDAWLIGILLRPKQ